MASNSRRARRAKTKINMTLEQIVADINAAVGQLDNFAQQAAGDETTNRAVIARLTQGVVLAGTAIEILSGLVQAEKMVAATQAAEADEASTDESAEA